MHYHDWTVTEMGKPTKLYHSHSGRQVIEDGVVVHDHDKEPPHYLGLEHEDEDDATPPDRSSRKRTTDQIVAATKPPNKQACEQIGNYDYGCW